MPSIKSKWAKREKIELIQDKRGGGLFLWSKLVQVVRIVPKFWIQRRPQAWLAGPRAWLAGPQAWLAGPEAWLDGLEGGSTNGRRDKQMNK